MFITLEQPGDNGHKETVNPTTIERITTTFTTEHDGSDLAKVLFVSGDTQKYAHTREQIVDKVREMQEEMSAQMMPDLEGWL